MPETLQATLGTKKVMATIAVKEVEVARKFYEDVLGLQSTGPNQPGVLSFASADTMVLVYESQYAGTNKATAATWVIDSSAEGGIEAVVAALKDKGVVFEHYDFPETTRQGDVHVSGKMKVVWFKDPDGNILAVFSE
ncbi:MAG: Glyoxalase/bleomycin resistance protein/dioxygenase [Rhodocyclales bacterium]|nr:Glyoxalase/bleomycin resistance protein/dioxygenase [Rhodocyclales bacterium]